MVTAIYNYTMATTYSDGWIMNRRMFVRSVLSAVAAGAVLDTDKLLWVPGQKTIFLPSGSWTIEKFEVRDPSDIVWPTVSSSELAKIVERLMITRLCFTREEYFYLRCVSLMRSEML